MVTKAQLAAENEQLRARLQTYEEVHERPEREDGHEDDEDDDEQEENQSPFPALTPPIPVPEKEPKIAEPPEFHGKVSEFATFICHCDLYFNLRPITFQSDYRKVTFVISRLRGVPSEWGYSLLQSNSPLLHSYDRFKKQMESMYLDRQRKRVLRRKLTSLTQTGSASAFASEFLTLINILGIDDESAIAMFTSKLKEDVQRGLALIDEPETLNQLVEAAVRIDHVTFSLAKDQRNASRAANKPNVAKSSSSGPSHSHSYAPSSRTSTAPPKSSNNNKPTTYPSHPRGPLSQEEKDRREREGLCGYCASSEHLRANCPLLAKKERQKAKEKQALASTSVASTQVVTSGPPPDIFRSGKPVSHNP